MNKKGTTMVEAAVVFPIVILAVMAVIYILMFLFQHVEGQSKMHVALRKESGSLSQTVRYLTTVETEYPVYKKDKQVCSQRELHFTAKGILQNLDKEISAHGYIDNERKIVRYFDLIKKKE